MKKLLSLLLALTMILPLVGCAAFAENADPIMITVIATSDVHGKVLPINYATGEPSPNVGLSMIASMIEQVRATEENVVLVDGGDTVQGSAMTYYYSYFAPEKDDPMMKALRLIPCPCPPPTLWRRAPSGIPGWASPTSSRNLRA